MGYEGKHEATSVLKAMKKKKLLRDTDADLREMRQAT
jgi:hypothetical protein